MLKKSHGPSLRKEQITLAWCPVCRGKAVIKGVFHDLACSQCNASGWVNGITGEALPLEELVTQLSLRLQQAESRIEQLKKVVPIGAAALYQRNNRRGAGGTNFTGD